MVIGNDNFNTLSILVENDFCDFCRLERVDNECRGLFVPGNDVNLLALKLADNRLNPAAAHADTSPDRIDGRILRNDGDLGPRTRIPGDGPNFDHPIVDFRYFLREQLRHELWMGSAREKSADRAVPGARRRYNRPDPVASAEDLARDQLVPADDPLTSAEIDDDVSIFRPLDDAVDDFAHPVFEFLVLAITLRFPHLSAQSPVSRTGRQYGRNRAAAAVRQ